MADMYAPISPYVYVANNPLIYTDPNGMNIVDSDGNVVTVAINENDDGDRSAEFSFAEGTSKRTKRKFEKNGGSIISTLINSDEGLGLVNDAIDSKDDIHIATSSEERLDKVAETAITGSITDVSTGEERKTIEITIFDGSIAAFSDPKSAGYGSFSMDQRSKTMVNSWNSNGLNYGERRASALGHELHHATVDIPNGETRKSLTPQVHQNAYDVQLRIDPQLKKSRRNKKN